MNIRRRFRKLTRAASFWVQRRTRGFDDSETWSLDYSLAKLILPRLRRFRDFDRKGFFGIPANYDGGSAKWEADLDAMIAAFEFAASDNHWDAPDNEWDKAHAGIKLFAENYFALWS